MKIRKAQKEDINEIAKIFRKESYKKPYNTRFTPKLAIKKIEDLFRGEIYVAEDKDNVGGFIASKITPDNKKRAYINEIWLKPEYQEKGIGKSLIKFIEKFYKKKGINSIRLVSRRSSKAFDFYKKIKYKEYKDLVFMEKKLK